MKLIVHHRSIDYIGDEMPKDPTRNIDRYKIRGGQLNEFDFARQHSELAHEQDEQSNQGGDFQIPSEQAKAERIKRLLAKYGEHVPGEKNKGRRPKSVKTAKTANSAKTAKREASRAKSKSNASGESAKKAIRKPASRKSAASKSTNMQEGGDRGKGPNVTGTQPKGRKKASPARPGSAKVKGGAKKGAAKAKHAASKSKGAKTSKTTRAGLKKTPAKTTTRSGDK